MEHGNGAKAVMEAGYKVKDNASASVRANEILRKPKIAEEIGRRRGLMETKAIASAQEVMEYFTKVMKGEIKDQFGLDAPLAERTKAAQELAKRTVDIENRSQGKADAVVEIKLNWKRD